MTQRFTRPAAAGLLAALLALGACTGPGGAPPIVTDGDNSLGPHAQPDGLLPPPGSTAQDPFAPNQGAPGAPGHFYGYN